MLKVLQVCVRGRLRRGLCFEARRAPAAAGLGAARPPQDAGVAPVRSLTKGGVRVCTVDPHLEEQFLFLECTDPEEEPHQEDHVLHQLGVPSAPGPGAGSGSLADGLVRPRKHLRSLEQQLQVLRGGALPEMDSNSLIEFHDADFPLDDNVLSAKKKGKKKKKATAEKGEHKVFGSPDVDEPISDTSCSGCGAVLHCTASSVPGYLPSEKFKELLQEGCLSGAICQRCHLLTHHHKALHLQLSKEQYRDVVRQMRPHKALVLLIVDLLDLPDSIVPDLPNLVGTNKHIVVLGNKIDLLPRDSPNYLQRIKRQLSQYCQDAGFNSQVTDVHLISAKTGYGIEGLITSLQRAWKYKGDVYLVGSANAGKSTLFNTLLESDYCKSRASDAIQKATISPWPGTTLNLLKFPITNPTPYRMFRREERLREATQQTERELSAEELKRLQRLCKHAYLVGRIGRTFRTDGTRPMEFQFDPDSLAFEENGDGETLTTAASRLPPQLTHNELKDAHWLNDTPGIIKEHDILPLLREQEVRSVVPTQAIIPRTFVLKPSMTLFVGALARIDFLQGEKSCWLSVMASSQVPVHVTSLEKADAVYQKHAGHRLLGVPVGGSERMKDFPALVSQEVQVDGRGYLEAAVDITLSSIGWVAVTAVAGDQLLLRVHGPQAAGFGLRAPPLLPHIVSLKGERIRKSAAYKPVKCAGLLDSGLSAHGAERLQVKKRKK